ncbi:MAG: hypothetical protein H8E86_04400 [Planctomycetes bacterium]|nr:hypothetical protein [Planctomycetota bacterium]
MTEPAISTWSSLVGSPSGEIFGTDISVWKRAARKTLGLQEKPIIISGHQPEFFHAGILAKFVAARAIADEIDGVVVHLVVDHHIGQSGVIEVPDTTGRYLSTKKCTIATLQENVAMKDQPRVSPQLDNIFSRALCEAVGDNAAMQFANATDDLMTPWATVDHCIGASALLETDLGKAIIEEMLVNPQPCIAAYNNALMQYPSCGIPLLEAGELPLWQGKTNEKATRIVDDLRPRALLLTLLARVVLGDLFVHGSGGCEYDQVMERWATDWLNVTPCAMVMATANVTLPLFAQSIEEARKTYFDAPSNYVEAIATAPYGSPERKRIFLALHKWLEGQHQKPDIRALKNALRIAKRRDWPFPLYANVLTKDFSVAKSAQASLSYCQ